MAPHLPWVSSKPTMPTIPTNPAPSSDHPFATNHPHATSTTQKRRPICRGSHPAMSVSNTPNPARRNRPKGLFLLPFSSFISTIRIRVKVETERGGVIRLLSSHNIPDNLSEIGVE